MDKEAMLKKQLEFTHEYLNAMETQAVKQAIAHERRRYKRMKYYPDKRGYETYWAKEIIKRQRGSTLLYFKSEKKEEEKKEPKRQYFKEASSEELLRTKKRTFNEARY